MGKQKQRGKRTQRKSRRAGGQPGHLPMLRDTIVSRFTQRYANANTTSTAIGTLQPYQLINSNFVTVDVAASKTVMSVINAIKIIKVEAWSPPGPAETATAYSGNTLRLGWVSSESGNPNFGRDKFVTDTTMGIENAHCVLRPIKGTVTAMWQTSGSNQPWDLYYSIPVSGVMDITFEFTWNNAESATSDNGTVTLATDTPAPGVIYVLVLAGSGGNLLPQVGDYIL